jgi:hypothetical protein
LSANSLVKLAISSSSFAEEPEVALGEFWPWLDEEELLLEEELEALFTFSLSFKFFLPNSHFSYIDFMYCCACLSPSLKK